MERQRSIRRRRRNEKSFGKKCKEYARNFIAFMFSNVGIIGLVVGYAIAGAFIFIHIEKGSIMPYNVSIAYNMSRFRNETAVRLWNLTLSLNVFNQSTWRELVKRELKYYQLNTTTAVKGKGYNAEDEDRLTKMWNFSAAFLYSLTVITTIGYGHIVPKSDWGKVTTIIYAIIGMPLFLLYLSNIGDIMARSFKWLYATCCLCKGCPGVSQRRAERKRRKMQQLQMEMAELPSGSDFSSESSWQGNGGGHNTDDGSLDGYKPEDEDDYAGSVTTSAPTEDSFDTQTVTVPVSICLTIMVGYIFSGAWLFSHYEDWGFLDASYFCFISLSTIGFGDIVPGDKIYSATEGFDVDVSFVLCSMYLMLGMALIAMCFNLMQEEVIHKFRSAVATIKYCLRCGR